MGGRERGREGLVYSLGPPPGEICEGASMWALVEEGRSGRPQGARGSSGERGFGRASALWLIVSISVSDA